jgi:hypothetical protein
LRDEFLRPNLQGMVHWDRGIPALPHYMAPKQSNLRPRVWRFEDQHAELFADPLDVGMRCMTLFGDWKGDQDSSVLFLECDRGATWDENRSPFQVDTKSYASRFSVLNSRSDRRDGGCCPSLRLPSCAVVAASNPHAHCRIVCNGQLQQFCIWA